MGSTVFNLILLWVGVLAILLILAAMGRISWWAPFLWILPVVGLIGILLYLASRGSKSRLGDSTGPKENPYNRLYAPKVNPRLYVPKPDPRLYDFTSGLRPRRKKK